MAIRNGSGSTKNLAISKARQGREKVLKDGEEADRQRWALGGHMATNMRLEF